MVTVPADSAEFRAVAQEMRASVPSARLRRLERVQNGALYHDFAHQVFRHRMRTGRADVQYLWHASPVIDKICSNGFDPSYSHDTLSIAVRPLGQQVNGRGATLTDVAVL